MCTLSRTPSFDLASGGFTPHALQRDHRQVPSGMQFIAVWLEHRATASEERMAIDDLAIAFITMADLAGGFEILLRQVQCVLGAGDRVAVKPLNQFIGLRDSEQLLRTIKGFNLGLSLAGKG